MSKERPIYLNDKDRKAARDKALHEPLYDFY